MALNDDRSGLIIFNVFLCCVLQWQLNDSDNLSHLAPVRTVTWLNCEHKVLILGKSEALNLRFIGIGIAHSLFSHPSILYYFALKKIYFNGLHIVECTVLCIEFRLMIFQKKTSLQKVFFCGCDIDDNIFHPKIAHPKRHTHICRSFSFFTFHVPQIEQTISQFCH